MMAASIRKRESVRYLAVVLAFAASATVAVNAPALVNLLTSASPAVAQPASVRTVGPSLAAHNRSEQGLDNSNRVAGVSLANHNRSEQGLSIGR